jgi:reductive dehalogenase
MSPKQKEQPEKASADINRRDFLKASGLTAGAIGLATVAKVTPAQAGERPESLITDFAVSHAGTPTYDKLPFKDAAKLKRFDYRKVAFEDYELMEKKFGGKYWAEAMAEVQSKKAQANTNGFTHLDWALDAASWSSYNAAYWDDPANPANMLSWIPLQENLHPELKKWKGTPKENSHYVKKAAHFFGSGPAGVAKLNEQWFYTHSAFPGYPTIEFSDTATAPERTNEKCIIPRSMNRVIVMTCPTDGMLLKHTPSITGGLGTSHGYSTMMELAGKMANFIRMLGYNAAPTVDCASLIVPQAIDAGLGELGRNGLLVNPELGQNLRITTLITDMPLEADKPIEFGVADFCKTCKKCADLCPSESINKTDDTTYETTCSSNNPGMKKYYVNTQTCLDFWVKSGGGCSNCIAVCPYSKPGTWIHDIVKAVSSKTPLLNSTFIKLDDALGYGSTFEKNPDARKWWTSKGRPKTWPTNY